MSPSRTLFAIKHLRPSLAALLTALLTAPLLNACAGSSKDLAVITPPGELPALILPEGLLSNGTTPARTSERRQSPSKLSSKPSSKPLRSADDRGSKRPSKSDPKFLTASPQPTSYALVIGIENYRDVPAATGARIDAERFAEVMRTTFGMPAENLRVLLDERASRSDITKELRWLAANVPPGGRVYFFYSGHGAPEPTKGTSYIVPYDGDPNYLADTALQMRDVVDKLEQTRAKEVIAFADSCFSGAGGRSVLPKGTRPLVRVAKTKAKGRVTLFSASTGAEISGPAADGQGGLFTSHLLEALGTGAADIDGDGQISLKELHDWISPRVSREAKRDNREQHPELSLGSKVGDPDQLIIGWGYAR